MQDCQRLTASTGLNCRHRGYHDRYDGELSASLPETWQSIRYEDCLVPPGQLQVSLIIYLRMLPAILHTLGLF